jgi:hypothetical protein
MALPANVTLASKFESKLDDAFRLSSYTDQYVNKDYNFDGVNSITVYNLDVTPLVAYDVSNNANRYGGFSEITDTTETYTLTNDQAFQKTLDMMNEQDSAGAKKIGAWLAKQMNRVVVPEIDKNRFVTANTAARDAAGGGVLPYSAATILDDIFTMGANCDEVNAPDSGRVFFVDSLGYKDIKAEVMPILHTAEPDILHSRGLQGTIDGLPIVKVPSALLPTGVRGLFWHKDALLAARKLTETRIVDGAWVVSGKIVLGRIRHDSFALKGHDNISGIDTKMATFHAIGV